jgi:isopentenyl phosphate kinase
MIQQGLNIRDEFKDKVKNFCSLNNVEWSDNVYESVTGGIVGKVEDVVKVMEYIYKLEQNRLEERKNKSFWWRLWN